MKGLHTTPVLKHIVMALAGAGLAAGCASTPEHPQPGQVVPVMRSSGEASPRALYDLGRYYQGQARYAEALAAYRRALAADPAMADARNGIGVIHAMQGTFDLAVREFGVAVNAAPQAAHIRNNLGYAYLLSGSPVQAAEAFQHALALEPGNARYLSNLRTAQARMSQDFMIAGAPDDGRASDGTAAPAAARPLAVASGGEPQRGTAVESPAEGQSAAAALPEPSAVAVPAARPAQVALEPMGSAGVAPAMEVPPASIAGGLAIGKIVTAESREPFPAEPVGGEPTAVYRSEAVLVAPNVYEIKPSAGAVSQPRHVVFLQIQPARLEVSNGNGVTGMARRVALYLREFGVPGARLTNQAGFDQRHTVIQYRTGFEAQAGNLKEALGRDVALVPTKRLRSDVDVRLVLGRDLEMERATFSRVSEGRILMAEGSGEMWPAASALDTQEGATAN